ncbi:hypothetical protein IAR50_002636 [Cryptococcus sp. DSM 104548]
MRYLKPSTTIHCLMPMLMVTDRVIYGQGGLVMDGDEVLDQDQTLMQCGIEDGTVLRVMKIERRPSQSESPKTVTVVYNTDKRTVSIPNSSIFNTVAAIRHKILSMLSLKNRLTQQVVYKAKVLDEKMPIADLGLAPNDVLQLVDDGPLNFEVKNIANNPSPYIAVASLHRMDLIVTLKEHLFKLFKIPVNDQKLWINARPVPEDDLFVDNLALSAQTSWWLEAKPMHRLCKTSNGDMPLFVSFEDKVGSLRNVFHHHRRVNFSSHDLVYNGVILSDDSRTLGPYSIGSQFHICVERKPSSGRVENHAEPKKAADISIYIRNLLGEYQQYQVKHSMSVDDLKAAIEAREVEGAKTAVVRHLKARGSEARSTPDQSTRSSKKPRAE